MKNLKAIIFDFDGTVVDTGEGILKSLRYSFEVNGRSVPDLDDLKRFIGPPIYYSFTHYYDVSEDEVGNFIAAYRKRYRQKGIFECKLYDGMLETLFELKNRGIKLGIASSKPQSLIYDVSNHLQITDIFDSIVGTPVDDSNHSSKTDLILDSISKIDCADVSSSVMVGDRLYDMEGAIGANVCPVGAAWGYGSEEELLKHGAKLIVSHPSELLSLLEE